MTAVLSRARPAVVGNDRNRRPGSANGARSTRGWLRALVPISLVAVATLALTGTFEVDSFYALYTGRVVASSGPPHTEMLTYAASHSWIDQQWLGQWLFFEADRLGGLAAVALMCLAATTLAGVLLARLAARRGGALPIAWATLGVVTVGFITVARTQTLVYPLFVALLWLLTSIMPSERWRPRAVLAIPILLLWANVHGSALLGVGLTVSCMLLWAVRLIRGGYARDALAAASVAVAAGLSILATPYGLSVVHYYSSLMGNDALRMYVSDWRRTSLLSLAVLPFIVLCALAAISVSVHMRRTRKSQWNVELLVAAAALAALAFYSSRYVVWAALALPYVASTQGTAPQLKVPGRGSRAVGVLASAVLVVLLLALATTSDSSFSKQLPGRLAAEAALTTVPGDVVLADQSTSTALLWLHPTMARHVAFDIRYEQYSKADLVAYFRFLGSRNQSLACRYDVVAISSKERPALVRALRTDPAWTATYDGKDGIVAVRTPGTTCA